VVITVPDGVILQQELALQRCLFRDASCSFACPAFISWTTAQVTPATGAPPASVCASWISRG
jgi:hypothetical protein